MKTCRFVLIGLAALVLSGVAVLAAQAEKEQKVDYDTLPAAVQATIQQHLNGGTVKQVEMEQKDGATLYEVDAKVDGKEVEFKVAADGTYLGKPADEEEAEEANEEHESKEEKEETTISVTDAPPAVQEAIHKIVAGNPITKVTKETEEDVAEYEAEYTVAGVEQSVKLSEAGDVMKVESGMDPNALPAAVSDALTKEFPGGTISDASAVEAHYYEIDIQVNGKTHEVKVSPSGEIKGGEHEGKEGKMEWKKEGHHEKNKMEHEEKEGDEDND